MAWDSFLISETLSGEVDPAEFLTAFEKSLRKAGALRFESFGPNAARLRIRPKGHLMRGEAKLEVTHNKRTNALVANISGTSNLSLLSWIAVLFLCILTSGLFFPIAMLIVVFTRKKPRESLTDALKGAKEQV